MTIFKKLLLMLCIMVLTNFMNIHSAQQSAIVSALGGLSDQLEQLRTQQILLKLETIKGASLPTVSREIGDDFKNYSNEILGYIYDSFTSLGLNKGKFSKKVFIDEFNAGKQSKKTFGSIVYPMKIKKFDDMSPEDIAEDLLMGLGQL